MNVDNTKFMIGVKGAGGNVRFLKPIPLELSKDDAIELAAWICCLIDPEGQRVQTMITKILHEQE
jgi:hypothetical protein